MNEYAAVVTRAGNYWLGEVRGLPGGRSYAGSLTSLRKELTDAIILADDLPDDAAVHIIFVAADDLPDDIRDAFAIAAERDQVASRTARMTAETARLARVLTSSGFSVRDTAGALGITSGRVSQLVTSR